MFALGRHLGIVGSCVSSGGCIRLRKHIAVEVNIEKLQVCQMSMEVTSAIK